MGLLKLIEAPDRSNSTIVFKFDLKNDTIARGSKLTVREGQNAIFCHKGKMADVFLPGFYTLDTDSVPLLTKLMGWKYGFQDPFKSEIYFVNMRQFTKMQWGTRNPITVRDNDYGAIQVRGYGSFSFRVDDAFVFMTELSGSSNLYNVDEIATYIKSMIVMGVTDTIAESKIPFLDLAANLIEFGGAVIKVLQNKFKAIGIRIEQFNFENISLPEELDKVLKETIGLKMKRSTMDLRMQEAQAQALINASKNPGTAGGFMGAGMGMGMGAYMGRAMGDMMSTPYQQTPQKTEAIATKTCPCGATVPANAKFCPECGKLQQTGVCPRCNNKLLPNAKFCPECGEKL
ncbi:MAG: SPFH domain-containing protein [Christensenellaceae bacterium]|jgi:membrane protease subunit (stomatin/prohibitin family)|nr:SPFH domain-containing protein [Christensenellaceae bacterium]